MRSIGVGIALLLLSAVTQTSVGYAADTLDGTWTITAMIEDGNIVPEDTIKTRFAQEARFVVTGQTITYTVPGSREPRTVLFTTNDTTTPKSFDLAGAEKVNGKGIYTLIDDVLMLCLNEPENKERPTNFTAKEGSGRILLTLHRTKVSAHKPPPPPVVTPPKTEPKTEPKVVLPPAPQNEKLRDLLIGTWGHQTDDWVHMVTFNADGTYSGSRTYKHRFGRLFNENVRSSGKWKVDENVVILTCTASTDREQINQISSYRIRSISASEVISVDQFGRLRRDWKSK